MSNIPSLIKQHREFLKINQVEYGKMFGVQGAAVSLWEAGKRKAPYKVIEKIIELPHRQVCSFCDGTGFIVMGTVKPGNIKGI